MKATYSVEMKPDTDPRVLGAHLFPENGLLYIGDNVTQGDDRSRFMANFLEKLKIFSVIRCSDVHDPEHGKEGTVITDADFAKQGLEFKAYRQQLIDAKILDEGNHVIVPLAKRYEL